MVRRSQDVVTLTNPIFQGGFDMSRKIMLRWAAGMSLFLLCVAVRVSWSDDFDADDSLRPLKKQAAVKLATPEPDARELRQRIVELMSKRAERMSNDELTRAIDELSKTIADQDTAAEAELQKAIDQLKSVVAKFPGTPAAERGSRALEAIEPSVKIAPKKGPTPRHAVSDDEDISFLSDDEAAPPPVKKTPLPPASKRTR
jgi:hypothetical protein